MVFCKRVKLYEKGKKNILALLEDQSRLCDTHPAVCPLSVRKQYIVPLSPQYLNTVETYFWSHVVVQFWYSPGPLGDFVQNILVCV